MIIDRILKDILHVATVNRLSSFNRDRPISHHKSCSYNSLQSN